jgi:hypothetical protein
MLDGTAACKLASQSLSPSSSNGDTNRARQTYCARQVIIHDKGKCVHHATSTHGRYAVTILP